MKATTDIPASLQGLPKTRAALDMIGLIAELEAPNKSAQREVNRELVRILAYALKRFGYTGCHSDEYADRNAENLVATRTVKPDHGNHTPTWTQIYKCFTKIVKWRKMDDIKKLLARFNKVSGKKIDATLEDLGYELDIKLRRKIR